jgi:hypothetical protein
MKRSQRYHAIAKIQLMINLFYYPKSFAYVPNYVLHKYIFSKEQIKTWRDFCKGSLRWMWGSILK